jgi:hypothetical protein
MFVNAKQKNQALPQKNLRAKQNLPPKTGASVKTQSSKNVSCVFKNSKLPTSKIKKKGSIIVQQDENDKNYKNLDTKCSLNPIEEKPKLSSLPFIRSNSVSVNNSNFPLRSNSGLNFIGGYRKGSKEEINKWLMRI